MYSIDSPYGFATECIFGQNLFGLRYPKKNRGRPKNGTIGVSNMLEITIVIKLIGRKTVKLRHTKALVDFILYFLSFNILFTAYIQITILLRKFAIAVFIIEK
jgi:hypothetical protein